MQDLKQILLRMQISTCLGLGRIDGSSRPFTTRIRRRLSSIVSRDVWLIFWNAAVLINAQDQKGLRFVIRLLEYHANLHLHRRDITPEMEEQHFIFIRVLLLSGILSDTFYTLTFHTVKIAYSIYNKKKKKKKHAVAKQSSPLSKAQSSIR